MAINSRKLVLMRLNQNVKFLMFVGFLTISIVWSQEGVERKGFVFYYPERGNEGEELEFKVVPSDTIDATDYRYKWNFGDGRMEEERGPETSYTYAGQGPNNGFNVSVTIRDARNKYVYNYASWVDVFNVPTEIFAELRETAIEGESIYFEANH